MQKSFMGSKLDLKICAGAVVVLHTSVPPRGVWGHAPPKTILNFRPSESTSDAFSNLYA